MGGGWKLFVRVRGLRRGGDGVELMSGQWALRGEVEMRFNYTY